MGSVGVGTGSVGVGAGSGSVGGVGSGRSIVHVRVAGVGSRLPALSLARTAKTWLPSVSAEKDLGESQAAQAPPSSWHSNLARRSEAKANDADWELTVPAGPEAIEVSGGVVSATIVSLLDVCADGRRLALRSRRSRSTPRRAARLAFGRLTRRAFPRPVRTRAEFTRAAGTPVTA
jgi:hypothetical protein